MWKYRGQQRPDFATDPGPGQESVWDYPRPPALVPDTRRVIVRWQGQTVVDTQRSYRVLESASPPTFYFPPDSVNRELLAPDDGKSFCEWKGAARYFKLRRNGAELRNVAWCYPQPTAAFKPIAGWLAFYPQQLDCEVGGMPVRAQAGNFYAGWITDDIVGPFKGEAGTTGW